MLTNQRIGECLLFCLGVLSASSATSQAVPCPPGSLGVDGSTAITECQNDAEAQVLSDYTTIAERLEATCSPMVLALRVAKHTADIQFLPSHIEDKGCFKAAQPYDMQLLALAAKAIGWLLGPLGAEVLGTASGKIDDLSRTVCVSPLSKALIQYKELLAGEEAVIADIEKQRSALKLKWPSIDAKLAELRAVPKGSNAFEASRLAADRRASLIHAYCEFHLIDPPDAGSSSVTLP